MNLSTPKFLVKRQLRDFCMVYLPRMKPTQGEGNYYGFQMNQGQNYPMQMNPQMMGTIPMAMHNQMGLAMPGMQPMMNHMGQQPGLQPMTYTQASAQISQPLPQIQQYPGMRPMAQMPGQIGGNMGGVQIPGLAQQQQMQNQIVPGAVGMPGQFGYQTGPKQYAVKAPGQQQRIRRTQSRKRGEDGDSDDDADGIKSKRATVTVVKTESLPNPPSPQTPIVDTAQEMQALFMSLEKASDAEAFMFLGLFGCTTGKERSERQEMFARAVAPKLARVFPSAPKFLGQLIGQIRMTKNVFMKLKEPKVPTIFRRIAGSRKIFKNILLEWPRFEIALTQRERKSMIIGSFVCFSDGLVRDLAKSLRLGQAAPTQCRFGERDDAHFFVLPNNVESGRYDVCFTGQPSHKCLLAWFVVQFVEAKTPEDVVAEILARAGVRMSRDRLRSVAVKTGKCRDDCCFNACRTIEELLESGDASCPCCKAKINIAELQVLDSDKVKDAVCAHSTPEMRAARDSFSDQLAALMLPAQRAKENWMDFLLNTDQKETAAFEPIVYGSTDEFQKCLRRLADPDCL